MSYFEVTFPEHEWRPPCSRTWTRQFQPRERNSPSFRREVMRQSPGTRFDVEEMDDSNIDSYWWIGVPDVEYPRKMYHLVRNRALEAFDARGSFAAKEQEALQQSGQQPRPPSLLNLAADKIRRQECLDAATASITGAQMRYGPWTSESKDHPEFKRERQIRNETILQFLDRMGPQMIAAASIRENP